MNTSPGSSTTGKRETLRQVEELFSAALEAPCTQREALLRGAPDEIRAEVESLLASAPAADARLEHPAWALRPNRQEELCLPEGTKAGQFTIQAVIGRGGMGVVYRARQESPPRDVALKVLARPFPSDAMTERFKQESHALARLQHPGIVSIIQSDVLSGAWGSVPYFAMELIEGMPLHRFADTHGLSLRERVGLIVSVCEAVQHAHQRGVIHRDLKPDNVLVDPQGRTRVLDFGISRLMSAESKARMGVDLAPRAGTLAFMSPEQVAGTGEDVDTRTDVYALGVLLYQLTSGKLPIPVKGDDPLEAMRAILEDEPAPLGSLRRDLRGDLELIASTALAKNPAKRYQSAGHLGDDLRRYLQSEPISVRPARILYLVGRYVRRNRIQSIAAAIVVTALVGGAITTVWQLRRAVVAEHLAAQRLDDVRKGATELVTELSTRLWTFESTAEVQSFLAGEAMARLDALVAASGDDPRALWDLSTACLTLGGSKGHSGQPNEGQVQFARSVMSRATTIRERLVAQFPRDMRYAIGCADANCKLSLITVEREIAARLMARSIELLRIATTSDPANTALAMQFAYTLATDGSIRSAAGEPFEESFRAARELCERVVAVSPGVHEYRGTWGTVVSMHATAMQQQGLTGAISTFQEAKAILAPLLQDAPNNYSYVRHIARANRSIALDFLARGERDQAREVADDVVTSLRAWHSKDPTNSVVRLDLANALLVAADVRLHDDPVQDADASVLAREVEGLMLRGRAESDLTLEEQNRWHVARSILERGR